MTERDHHDPKGLVREAYAIPGVTEPECRSIFLDWALSLPDGADPALQLEPGPSPRRTGRVWDHRRSTTSWM